MRQQGQEQRLVKSAVILAASWVSQRWLAGPCAVLGAQGCTVLDGHPGLFDYFSIKLAKIKTDGECANMK